MNVSNKEALTVRKAKVTYSYFCTAFPDGSDPESNWEVLKEKVRGKYQSVWFDDISDDHASLDIFQDISIAQNFLHNGNLPFPCKRMYINDFSLSHPFINITDDSLLLSYYADVNVFQFALNLTLENASLDSLVYMRQIFCNTDAFSIRENSGIRSDGAEKKKEKRGTWAAVTSSSTIHEDNCLYVSVEKMYHSVMGDLDLKTNNIQTNFLSEINNLGNLSTINEVEETAYKEIYGLMTGDEGWMFVPDDLVKKRLENKWGTRDFVAVYSLGMGTVLINLDESDRYTEYMKRQNSYGGFYYGGTNPYFSIKSRLAGVAHGVFFSVETALVIKTIVNKVYAKQAEFRPSQTQHFEKQLHESREYRQQLISTLRLVENIGMSEIGELESMIFKSQEIEPVLEKLQYLLDLLEDELNLLYSENTNHLVNLLTIIGLLLTVVSIGLEILQFFPLT